MAAHLLPTVYQDEREVQPQGVPEHRKRRRGLVYQKTRVREALEIPHEVDGWPHSHLQPLPASPTGTDLCPQPLVQRAQGVVKLRPKKDSAELRQLLEQV